MSEKDVATTKYWEDSKRIADLLNVAILHGKRLFLPENIQVHGNRTFLPNQKERRQKTIEIDKDNVYKAQVQMKATIIALENQSDIHYAMPIRVMSGDSANYHNQWDKIKKQHGEEKDLKGAEYLSGFSKTDKLIPEITLVLYYGEESWDGPKCLKDILDLEGLPLELQNMVADYPLYLIEVRKFKDYELFETDLKLLFGFLQRDNDENALKKFITQNEDAFRDLAEDTFNMICIFSKSRRLITPEEDYKTETGGKDMDMCKAIDDMIKHGEERGFERGIQGMIKICQDFGASIESTIRNLMTVYSLTEDNAKSYVQKYWN